MEEKEVLVKVEGLSKKFCKDLKTSLWYGIKDLIFNVLGNKYDRLLREKEFWAVKNINFELRRGECLGLIGHNGAGKSTLLKILNGLILPDAGKVTIKGRVGALIELGAGFNPILTGRENIYNNGAILGFTRKEINEKIETIIDFAEIREFIDMPVRHYSSGMNVRLGFAVAAQMEPDVLIIDEVLAVGDLGFALKCIKTIDTILPHTAIIFVSHAMPMVSRICDKIILLDRGNIKYKGNNVGKGIDLYYSKFMNNVSKVVYDDGSLKLHQIEILNVDGYEVGIPQIKWKSDLKLHICLKAKALIEMPKLSIFIFDKEQRPVAIFTSNSDDSKITIKEGIIDVIMIHRNLQLSKGIYYLNFYVSKGKLEAPILRINDVVTFQIIHELDLWPPFLLSANYENYSNYSRKEKLKQP